MSAVSIAKKIFESLRDTHNDMKACTGGLFGMLTEKDVLKAVSAALEAEMHQLGVMMAMAEDVSTPPLEPPLSPLPVSPPKCFWCQNPPVVWDKSTYDGLCTSCTRVLNGRGAMKVEWLLSKNVGGVQ